MKQLKKITFLSAAMLLANVSNSLAAGYSTELYSASGLANSYAGSAAGIHDASDMFFNPAILSDIKKKQFIAAVSYLDLRIDAENASGKFSNNAQANGKESHNAGSKSFVPAFYFAMPVNEKLGFGLSVTSPFGLRTKYNSDWLGRYRAIESSVKTENINPSLSYKINEQFSVGAGVQAQYYQSTLTKAVPSVSYNASDDYFGKAHSNDWGYGYNLGATFKPNDNLKFGLGYRSKIQHKLAGKTKLIGAGLSSDFYASTVTPESLTAGAAFKLNPKIELAYDVTWTRWSRLKKLTANATQSDILNIGNTTNFNWHDSFLHSIGANFSINQKWLVRTGLAYEKEVATNANREVRIPTGDKIWTSIGFNYKIQNDFSLDATYLHQFYRAGSVNLTDSSVYNNSIAAKYKTRVDVLSIGVKKEF